MTKQSFINKQPYGNLIDIYIFDTIGPISDYLEHVLAINTATENDLIHVHINSGGGHCYTADHLYHILRNSPARVLTTAYGNCQSAATTIFLSGDEFNIANHTIFMIHNFSTEMGYDKGESLKNSITFYADWGETQILDVYGDFLTSEELQDIIVNNRDLYLKPEDVRKRCDKLMEIRNGKENL